MKTLPVLLISAFPAFAQFRRGRQLFLWLAVVSCVGGGFSAFGQGSFTPPGRSVPPSTPIATPTPTPIPPPTPAPTPSPGICQLRVLIVYADSAPPTMLQSQILAQPGVTAVDLFDASYGPGTEPTGGTPTLAQLQQYQIVVPFSFDQFANSITLRDNLVDYVDGGGVVVQFGDSFMGPGEGHGINGRWFNENYYAYSYSFNEVQNKPFALGTFNPAHPLMAGVSTLNSNFGDKVPLAVQATEVAAANNGNSLVAYRVVYGGRTTVAVSAHIGAHNLHTRA